MAGINPYIESKLKERHAQGNYRQLRTESGLVDFCSNDYLGFARSVQLRLLIEQEIAKHPHVTIGSTGSRLLAGNTLYAEQLEAQIAGYHGYQAGLIYNSGYDANVGLFSSILQKGDTIITDELIHASIIDGTRLSHANRFRFRHNDIDSLEDKLKRATGQIYIAVESIYSMDGDTAPLTGIAGLAKKYNAYLIVDEAHATGVFGKGMIDLLGLQSQVFAQVITFGKALGCHAAIVLGTDTLRQYLINFSRSFIYTTAAPFHQLAPVKAAYQMLQQSGAGRVQLQQLIDFFKENFSNQDLELIPSDSAIQCILVKSNERTKALAALIQDSGYDVRPILSPTVAIGGERLRVCLHAYNTEAEITGMMRIINDFKA